MKLPWIGRPRRSAFGPPGPFPRRPPMGALSVAALALAVACGSSHYDVRCSGGFAAAAGEAPDDTVFRSRAEAERFVELELESVRRTWKAPSGRVWEGECTITEHEGREHRAESAPPAS